MPAGNGMGPMGMGPMTGRAAGYCAGSGVPGHMNRVGGPGFDMGMGRGRRVGRGGRHGCRNMFYATGLPRWARAGAPTALSPEQELAGLKQQADQLGNALESTRKRIHDMESQRADK